MTTPDGKEFTDEQIDRLAHEIRMQDWFAFGSDSRATAKFILTRTAELERKCGEWREQALIASESSGKFQGLYDQLRTQNELLQSRVVMLKDAFEAASNFTRHQVCPDFESYQVTTDAEKAYDLAAIGYELAKACVANLPTTPNLVKQVEELKEELQTYKDANARGDFANHELLQQLAQERARYNELAEGIKQLQQTLNQSLSQSREGKK